MAVLHDKFLIPESKSDPWISGIKMGYKRKRAVPDEENDENEISDELKPKCFICKTCPEGQKLLDIDNENKFIRAKEAINVRKFKKIRYSDLQFPGIGDKYHTSCWSSLTSLMANHKKFYYESLSE